MHHLLEIWFGWVLHGGYWGIIALMAMESSVIPIPSEIVIPPAAFLAARGNLSMAAWLGAKAYQVQPDLISNVDGWVTFIKTRSHWIVLFVAVLAVLYLVVLRLTATKRIASSRSC